MDWIEGLRAIKSKANLSTREIAEKSGLPEPTLEKLFSGQTKNPGINTVRQLVHSLGHTLDDLDDAPIGTKKTSSLSDEAMKVAHDYNGLDDRGKGAVKAILAHEGKAVTELPEEPTKNTVALFPKAKKNSNGIVEIKTYDQPAAAGLGNYLDEPDYHIEQYPVDIIPSKADFGVIISGDSMEPKIHDGGTVFVQAAPSIDSGKIGIFVLNKQAYCKQLMVDRMSRQVRLVSLNKDYDDIIIKEFDELYTVGLVLGQWTKGHTQDIWGW